MPHPLIHVVTVNYNRPEDTLRCIDSLRHQELVDLFLIIVDNGSIDDSCIKFQKSAPDAYLLKTKSNLGFSGGFNRGIQYCIDNGAQFILIINNDTIADPSLLYELITGWDSDTAVTAPVIFYADQPNKIWSQGSRINWLLYELSENHNRSNPIPLLPIQRDFVSGCCMLLNRDAIESVGLLDEKFFLYYEDQDWCVRFRLAGYKLMIKPRARLWHKVSKSSEGIDSPKERYWMARSSVHYFYKHTHGLRWLLVFPWRLLSACRITIHLLQERRFSSIRAYWFGISDGILEHITNNKHPRFTEL